jgi:hypothetical protein
LVSLSIFALKQQRKASVLGQYFNLEDLVYFLDTDEDPEALRDSILAEDTYNFLSPGSDGGEYSYSFRHYQIMTAIYESLPYARRNEYHNEAAEFFEYAMTDLNRDHLLPFVCYHYAKTQNGSKRIEFTEEMGYAIRIQNLSLMISMINGVLSSMQI